MTPRKRAPRADDRLALGPRALLRVVAVGAPAARRHDLLAAGSALRTALALPADRYERHRVCDALIFRRGLPLYPTPSPGARARHAWDQWIGGVHGARGA